MKPSVSLPAEDIAFLDAIAAAQGTSRSAVLHRAVRLLRAAELGKAYEDAFAEWAAGDDATAWDSSSRPRPRSLGLGSDDGLAARESKAWLTGEWNRR